MLIAAPVPPLPAALPVAPAIDELPLPPCTMPESPFARASSSPSEALHALAERPAASVHRSQVFEPDLQVFIAFPFQDRCRLKVRQLAREHRVAEAREVHAELVEDRYQQAVVGILVLAAVVEIAALGP